MKQTSFLTVADAVRHSAIEFEKVISQAFEESLSAMSLEQKQEAFFPELINRESQSSRRAA